jgi:hypothetical protein
MVLMEDGGYSKAIATSFAINQISFSNKVLIEKFSNSFVIISLINLLTFCIFIFKEEIWGFLFDFTIL